MNLIARLGVLAFACLALAGLSVAQAEPARADRCQPEELVLGSGNSPYREEDSPICYVMLGYVYPTLGCDSETLITCVNTFLSGVDLSNPIPAQGPVRKPLDQTIYCTMRVVGGDLYYCIQ